jgi:hypothetical protein
MWANLDDQSRTFITTTEPPKEDVWWITADPNWGALFSNWLGASGYNQEALVGAFLVEAMDRDCGTLWGRYGDGGSAEVDWASYDPELHAKLQAAEQSGDFSQGLLGEWTYAAVAVLTPYVDPFIDEVNRIRGGSDATFSYDDIDWGFVRQLNEYLLKNLDAGGSMQYLQYGQAVLFDGEGTPPTYRQAMIDTGATEGQVYVDSRGGLTSRGKIIVTKSSDEDGFKAAIREFSNKQIEFSTADDII